MDGPPATLARFGNSDELKAKFLVFCSSNSEYEDLADIVSGMFVRKSVKSNDTDVPGTTLSEGYVYLIEAQRAYKICSSRAPYRRTAEIANQSAEGAKLLHLIATDDPEGIENYWHRRFAEKRISGLNKQSGEWFELTRDEVAAFKQRKAV